MVLETPKRLVEMGLDASNGLLRLASPDGRFQDSHLWILHHGFANGFYSIKEYLIDREGNKKAEPAIREAIQSWWGDTKDEYHAIDMDIRRQLTHFGKNYTAMWTIEWEEHDYQDTVFPVLGHVFAVIVDEYGNETRLTFNEWAQRIFLWWRSQLAEIERRYNGLKRSEARRASFKKPI